MSGGNWQPNPTAIGHIIQLITLFTSSKNEDQKKAFQMHKEMESHQEFGAYCAIVFVDNTQKDEVRQRAGLMLKETVRKQYTTMPQHVTDIVKQCLLRGAVSESPFVRRTAATSISALVRQNDLEKWENLPNQLLKLLETHRNDKTPLACEGLLHTFQNICLDVGQDLVEQDYCADILKAMLFFAGNNYPSIREKSLRSLFNLFHFQAQSFIDIMPQYCKMLAELAENGGNQSIGVRRILCESVIVAMNEYWEHFVKHSISIFKFMANATGDSDEELSKYAVEFWALYAMDTEPSKPNGYLKNYLHELVPLLVRRMRYTDDLLSAIDFDNDDTSNPDLEEDMKPIHYKGIQDKDDNKEEADESAWNIRKAAARQLDLLMKCNDLVEDVLKQVLPIIERHLKSNDALNREAGLLALGAASAHGFDFTAPQLPGLVPFILKQMKDSNILVASISCWVISRYARWFFSAEGEKFTEGVVKGLLEAMQSKSKRVQRAACSGLVQFALGIDMKLVKWIDPIMSTFVTCLKSYKLISYTQLVDCMMEITDIFAKDEQQNIVLSDKYQDTILPPILSRFEALCEGNSPVLFTLIEAITRWSSHMAHTPYFQNKYAVPIIKQSMRLCLRCKAELRDWEDAYDEAKKEFGDLGPDLEQYIKVDRPHFDLWSSPVDILCIMAEKCPRVFEKVVSSQPENGYFIEMLVLGCGHYGHYIRRNSLALAGDLIVHCPEVIAPKMNIFVPLFCDAIRPGNGVHCVNANWCIGMTLDRFGDKIKPYLDQIMTCLVSVLKNTELGEPHDRSITSITLARLINTCPAETVDKWDVFAVEWMTALSQFREDQDKINSFHTLLRVIERNPQGIAQHEVGIQVLFAAIASLQQPPSELVQHIQKILNLFRSAAKNWQNVLNTVDSNIFNRVKQNYQL